MKSNQENPLAKLQKQAKANPIIATAKTSVEQEVTEAVTPIVTLIVPYEQPRELGCAIKGDRSGRHQPCLASKLVYVGSVSKSIRQNSFAELVGGTKVEVHGRKALFNQDLADWKRDDNGNIIYSDQEEELMQFFVTWDVNRNTPGFSRSKEVGINLVPSIGVPREQTQKFTDSAGRERSRSNPDWNAMPKLQADITGPIRNCEEPLEICRKGEAKTPMGIFVGLIRETPQDNTQANTAPTGLTAALNEAGLPTENAFKQ